MSLATVAAQFGLAVAILAAPFVLIAGGLVATAVTVVMKWTLIGHYTRSEHPLWCSFVWRDEMMNAAQEQLADERLLRLDTHVGTDTRVFGHSVVLRGEELPAGTRWHGTPVVAL
jgi:hypothetical protein